MLGAGEDDNIAQGEYGFRALWLVRNQAQSQRGPGMVVGISEGRVELLDVLGSYESAPGDLEPVRAPNAKAVKGEGKGGGKGRDNKEYLATDAAQD